MRNSALLFVFLFAVLLSGCGGSKANQTELRSRAQQSQVAQIKWEKRSSGRARQAGTLFVSFDNYVSDDGMQAERSVEVYRSPEEARSRVAELLKEANRIVEPQREKYYDGLPGERIVLLTNKTDSRQIEALVCWRHDTDVEILQSVSLRHVLDLEQQINQPAAAPQR
jgi:hypothetical protein